MIRRQKQKEVSQTKIADKIIKNVEDNMTKRDEEMSGSMTVSYTHLTLPTNREV